MTFTNSRNNYYITKLFYELAPADKSTVLYTLKDQDYLGFPSLRRLYMEMEDILEYEFATKYFDGWEHWLLVANNKLIKPYITLWRTELELKVRTQALKEFMKIDTPQLKYAVNKYLLERGWKLEKKTPKDDEKTKQTIIKNAEKELSDEEIIFNKTVDQDFTRIKDLN